MARKFTTPNLRVWQAGDDTETAIDVQTTQSDAVRFDLVRSRMKWPATSEAPMLWATFLAWHALRRELAAGKRAPLPLPLADKPEDGLDAFDAVVFLDEDGNELDADSAEDLGVDPTQPTA